MCCHDVGIVACALRMHHLGLSPQCPLLLHVAAASCWETSRCPAVTMWRPSTELWRTDLLLFNQSTAYNLCTQAQFTRVFLHRDAAAALVRQSVREIRGSCLLLIAMAHVPLLWCHLHCHHPHHPAQDQHIGQHCMHRHLLPVSLPDVTLSRPHPAYQLCAVLLLSPLATSKISHLPAAVLRLSIWQLIVPPQT